MSHSLGWTMSALLDDVHVNGTVPGPMNGASPAASVMLPDADDGAVVERKAMSELDTPDGNVRDPSSNPARQSSLPFDAGKFVLGSAVLTADVVTTPAG